MLPFEKKTTHGWIFLKQTALLWPKPSLRVQFWGQKEQDSAPYIRQGNNYPKTRFTLTVLHGLCKTLGFLVVLVGDGLGAKHPTKGQSLQL